MLFRFLTIVQKNFKLLWRSKSSAFILFVGPILIIALVGFFFSGKSSYDLSIGYYAPEKTPLTIDFVNALKQSDYLVYSFKSEDACVEKIKQGVIHTCIIFPPGFQVKNANPSDLRFVVDYSRINLVYKVIDAVSGIIEFQTKQVSYSLTNALLKSINSTIDSLKEQEALTKNMTSYQKSASEAVSGSLVEISSLRFDTQNISTFKLNYNLNRTNASFSEVKAKGLEIVQFANELYEELDGYLTDSNESGNLRNSLDKLNVSLTEFHNDTEQRILLIFETVSDIDYSLSLMVRQADRNRQLSENIKNKTVLVGLKLDLLKKDLSSLFENIQSTRMMLESIDITRAETIVSPVNTKIEPLLSESSNLQFTFPFLLVLIIMFASLMISSTLVIFEKNSRALFRNFMTPVSQSIFTMASFVTVLLIILFQSIIILLITQFALGMSLFENLRSVILVILISATFFIVLGMMIGYIFSSQEGAVMASLVIGSSFLFVSNLVLPLESIAPGLSEIIKYNPFIIFSDVLRKSLLFNASIFDSILTLGVLFWLAIALLVFILAVKGFFNRHKVKMPSQKDSE